MEFSWIKRTKLHFQFCSGKHKNQKTSWYHQISFDCLPLAYPPIVPNYRACFFSDVNICQTRLYAILDKWFEFRCFIAKNKLMKVRPSPSYPFKNAEKILAENRGSTKLTFGIQTFLEKTKAVKNLEGSPTSILSLRETLTWPFVACLLIHVGVMSYRC